MLWIQRHFYSQIISHNSEFTWLCRSHPGFQFPILSRCNFFLWGFLKSKGRYRLWNVFWRHSHCSSHEHDVRKFANKCLWYKLPPQLGRTSILGQGMSLCSSWKPTIFGSFRGITALPRNIFIACSQHVFWLSTLANIMFLAAASGCAAEHVP